MLSVQEVPLRCHVHAQSHGHEQIHVHVESHDHHDHHASSLVHHALDRHASNLARLAHVHHRPDRHASNRDHHVRGLAAAYRHGRTVAVPNLLVRPACLGSGRQAPTFSVQSKSLAAHRPS